MICSAIIAKFEELVDDTTELSTAQELALLNKVYQKICDNRPWEFLKKEASGTMATTTTIAVPSDFAYFVENQNSTDNSEAASFNAKPTGILINGTKWLQLVNWSDRRQYANADGYVYYDALNNTLTTTYAQPSGATYSFDYKSVPAALLIGGTPVFPARYHEMIPHAMVVEDMGIQLFDKSRSYANENQVQFNSFFSDMCMWNANLQNM